MVKSLKVEDEMVTYKRLGRILYSGPEKRKPGRCEESFVGRWASVVDLTMLI
jgi:hypothetical protein